MTPAQPTLNVVVNGQPQVLQQAVTLAELVAQLAPVVDNLATALNGEFVPRNQRAGRILREGDHIICFQLIAGG